MKRGDIQMKKLEHMKLIWWNNKVVSVEKLHELASDERIRKIYLRSSVLERAPGAGKQVRELSHWELHYQDGETLNVYV